MRISVWGPAPELAPLAIRRGGSGTRAARGRVRRQSASRAQVFRGEPAPGTAVEGPALWALAEATLLVPPGWSGEVDRFGNVLLERDGSGTAGRR